MGSLLVYLLQLPYMHIYLYQSPKSIQISRENVVTRSNSFLKSISLLSNNFRSSTKKLCETFDLQSSPKEYTFYCPNIKVSGFTERINNDSEKLSLWNIPLAYWVSSDVTLWCSPRRLGNVAHCLVNLFMDSPKFFGTLASCSVLVIVL